MIKLDNYEVMGWEHAIRGIRNPLNSWDRSDSEFKGSAETECIDYSNNPDGEIKKIFVQFDALGIGPNDHELMMKLAKGGSVHAKYRRMITVYVDITAPLYWWKEFDTYKVGTVANSCSTMHKIHEKEFMLEDFSWEHLNGLHNSEEYDSALLMDVSPYGDGSVCFSPAGVLNYTVHMLNICRNKFLETKDKKYWWQMIQLLPSSYNQKRTVMLNYEVLAGIYESRKNHKLDEWREFCKWIEKLPYSEVITG
jgi:hypothetical protein